MTLYDRPSLHRAAELAEAVRKGRGRMPAFPMYSDADLGAVLAHLRSLGHS